MNKLPYRYKFKQNEIKTNYYSQTCNRHIDKYKHDIIN